MGLCLSTQAPTPARNEWKKSVADNRNNNNPPRQSTGYQNRFNAPIQPQGQPFSSQKRSQPTQSQLPAGWELKKTKDGRCFYVDHTSRKTQWHPPEVLPPGWEKKMTSNGRPFYVDHATRQTQWHPPDLDEINNRPSPMSKQGSLGWDEKILKDDNEVLLISRGWAGRYSVNIDHCFRKVAEVLDNLPGLESVNVHVLTNVFDRTTIKQSDLDMWTSYSDGKLFQNKSDARGRLKTICDYIAGTIATKKSKQQLKFIAKELSQDKAKKYDPCGILLLLASHGNVCNVMKEVGIQSAYSAMTNQTAAMFQSQTFEDRISQLLLEFREMMIEELYHTFGATNNTHSITLMRNNLAPFIGVEKIHDTQAGNWGLPNGWENGLRDKYFNNHYTVEAITRWILLSMNEEPRKIGYEAITNYLDKYKPIDDTYLFYTDVYDMESGQIKPRYVKWILTNLGIFYGPKISFEIPEVEPDVIEGEGMIGVNDRSAALGGPEELLDEQISQAANIQINTQRSEADLFEKWSSARVMDGPSREDMDEKSRHDMISRWQSQWEMYSNDPQVQIDERGRL